MIKQYYYDLDVRQFVKSSTDNTPTPLYQFYSGDNFTVQLQLLNVNLTGSINSPYIPLVDTNGIVEVTLGQFNSGVKSIFTSSLLLNTGSFYTGSLNISSSVLDIFISGSDNITSLLELEYSDNNSSTTIYQDNCNIYNNLG